MCNINFAELSTLLLGAAAPATKLLLMSTFNTQNKDMSVFVRRHISSPKLPNGFLLN